MKITGLSLRKFKRRIFQKSEKKVSYEIETRIFSEKASIKILEKVKHLKEPKQAILRQT